MAVEREEIEKNVGGDDRIAFNSIFCLQKLGIGAV